MIVIAGAPDTPLIDNESWGLDQTGRGWGSILHCTPDREYYKDAEQDTALIKR